ncbi:MAG: nucleotidyltransferase domain-containing protein [Parcubacteria group bacterium]|nr:nucleotidyltransferase domain-containing protein [Parcubacteria group bacterium]
MLKIPLKDTIAIAYFKDRLARTLEDERPKLILFGSKARGDFKPGSDIDILIVLKRTTPEKRRLISDVATDIFLKQQVDISPHIYSSNEYKKLRSLETPFMLSVKQDGITI